MAINGNGKNGNGKTALPWYEGIKKITYPDGTEGYDRCLLRRNLYEVNGALTPDEPDEKRSISKRIDSWLWRMAIEG